MNSKKKILIIATILVVFAIVAIIILSRAFVNYDKNVTHIDISKFEPFKKDNLLISVDTTLNIDSNLPKIEGASAFYPFAANLVQNVYDKNSYKKGIVELVSTSKAYKDLTEGKTDIVIATAPSNEQIELIENSGVELEYKVLYLEPLIIFKNIKNPVNNLSIEDLNNIYTNNCSWSSFVNIEKDINTYQLEKNNGSQTCFESIVSDNTIDDLHHEVKYMEKIIDDVGKDESGIGYAFSSYYNKMHINGNTSPIYINGYDYTSPAYPLNFEVYIIYDKNNQNENILKIVEWLNINEGQEYISKTV